MKEFIDKLINELEKLGEHCLYMNNWQGQTAICDAIEVVTELAEEYKVSENPTSWIPCERELPKMGQMCLCSVNKKYQDAPYPIVLGVYKEPYINRFADWYTAWMPLPAPYTEGE